VGYQNFVLLSPYCSLQ